MENILIVSSSLRSADQICEILSPDIIDGCFFKVVSISEARQKICTNDIDYIFINTPLKDDFGDDFAMSVSPDISSSVILLVKEDIADQIADKVCECGIFVVPKPINKSVFFQTVRLASALRKKVSGLKKANIKLQSRIDEMRLLDRAKCALIQYLNMTEKQAHRYIEKQAMDMRTTKADIAQGILKTYEI